MLYLVRPLHKEHKDMIIKEDHKFFILKAGTYHLYERTLDYPNGKVIGVYKTKKAVLEQWSKRNG